MVDLTATDLQMNLGELVHHCAKPGKTVTSEEVREHCRHCMAKYMVPSVVTILDNMPRTTTGKPEKGELRKLPL